MESTFTRLKYIFLGLFFLASAASAYHQIWIVKPRQECQRKGGWWDGDERVCATPIDLSLFTGRPNRPRTAGTPPRPTLESLRTPAPTQAGAATAPTAPSAVAPKSGTPPQP